MKEELPPKRIEVGMCERDAIEYLNYYNHTYRIIHRDDIPYIVITCDFKPNRFNLKIIDHFITDITFG